MSIAPIHLLLSCVGALLGLAVVAVALSGRRWASPLVYGACLVVTLVGLIAAMAQMLSGAEIQDQILPLGLPWIGARFHIDALAAVFLTVVDLGAALASLYALGYGRHEPEPQRVLPFYPAFLAGMNLVILAGDAFTFLVAWEVMSLASWALVMAWPAIANREMRGPATFIC